MSVSVESDETAIVMMDVCNKLGEIIGKACDGNPCIIDTDEQCKDMLLKLKDDVPFNDEETKFIDNCISVVNASDGDIVTYDPTVIIEFGNLAMKYPGKSHEFMACSHHISESINCEGDIPNNFYLQGMEAFVGLSALIAGDQSSDDDDDDDDSDSDSD